MVLILFFGKSNLSQLFQVLHMSLKVILKMQILELILQVIIFQYLE
ncbi:MAG: hypothetical protein UY05_C0009G0019, partial [Candidatus Peregrinibacteria bacterium GW2011_GWA2_47_7]